MNRGRILGPADCEESEFSDYEIEEEVRNIEHVVDVAGDEYGGPLGISDRPFVNLEGVIKGTPKEYEIKTEVERRLGPFVTYLWDGLEAEPEKIVQRNRRHVECGSQQLLTSYKS